MSQHTPIEWCDSTINPTSGCDGCELWNETKKICYAGNWHETRWSKSFAVTHPQWYSPHFSDVRMIPGRIAQAAAWSDLRGKDRKDKPWLNGRPRHIFVGDMGDFLSKDVTDDFLERELMEGITSKAGQRHVWMLVTKRPNRLAAFSQRIGGLPPNVIAMTSITNQTMADLRVKQLLQVKCHWRGLSAEPLWGPIDLDMGATPIHLIITGFESGKNALPGHPDWLRQIRDHCLANDIAYFHKQNGEWIHESEAPGVCAEQKATGRYRTHEWAYRTNEWDIGPGRRFGIFSFRVGCEKAGARLDGREWRELPKIELEVTA